MNFRSAICRMLSLTVGVCLAPQLLAAGPEFFSITNFGACGDGKTVNTEAIQKTIEAAAKHGGVVQVPAGTFMTGAIYLKSKVELNLAAGATLQAVTNEEAYPLVPTRIAGIEMPWPSALINVIGQQEVKVTGTGTIDGNGSHWWYKFWGADYKGGMLADYSARGLRWAVDYDCQRVRALVFYDSTNVTVKNVTIARSGFWSLTFTYCEHAQVEGLKVLANL
ncbi:MAG TPA: glycosyl hydrolase family 28-related protein, partial [Verrucomicrobiae bacterium]|nr:glycosyl hydrolase family 28-related protein [Verrucomicrobiae bacterium]